MSTKHYLILILLFFCQFALAEETISVDPERAMSAEVNSLCSQAKDHQACVAQVKQLMVTAFTIGSLNGKCEMTAPEDPYGICSESKKVRDHFANLQDEYLEEATHGSVQ